LKRALAIIIINLLPLLTWGQTDTVNTLVFKVSASKTKISVWPADSLLWIEKKNNLKIKIKGNKYPVVIKLEGGTISGKDSLYTAIVEEGVSALLNLWEKYPDGSSKLIYTKPYKIKKIPDPVVYVCGVKGDSAIDKRQLIFENKVYAYSDYYKSYIKIISFDMLFPNQELMDTLSSFSNRFTPEMRNKIWQLNQGSVVYFENIKCKMPNQQIKKLSSIQIFIVETNKYSVGELKFPKD
jgi:hypothetical protein